MILVDKPYVSDFLRSTAGKHDIPIVKTDMARKMGFRNGGNLISEKEAVAALTAAENPLVYTNSENAIGWITRRLGNAALSRQIGRFKDKARFREMLTPMYPDFFHRKFALAELEDVNAAALPAPFFLKPTVGFFSMGVCKVTHHSQWREVVRRVHADMRRLEALYPKEVLNGAAFIVEQAADGEEYAIDAYFDADGEPVILNILHHVFSSDLDVRDRVYITSREIVAENLKDFTAFLSKIGRLSGVRRFPAHVEVRRRFDRTIIPIEINPLRFGGWCTTADLAHAAYGFNPYVCYFSQTRPDWDAILKEKNDALYSVIVLDNTTGAEGAQIASFDYERVLSIFAKPLDLRKIDYTEYPVFGFLFAETPAGHYAELENILKSDLREYITLRR